MCGIAGGYNCRPVFNTSLQKRRGPDYQNTVSNLFDQNIWLFHSLLSIQGNIPVKQPIYSNTIALAFNGEIYNFRELNKKYGLKCQSDSDSETLFELLSKFSLEEVLSQLEGMFAFGLVSPTHIYLIRDSNGEKPLYYRVGQNSFHFSSVARDLGNSLNVNKLSEYVMYGFSLDSHTLISDVLELEPGTILSYDLKEKTIETIKYETRIAKDLSISNIEKVIINHASATIDSALLLSGGVDSNTINTILSRANLLKSTFTIDFVDSKSEVNYVKQNENEDVESSYIKYSSGTVSLDELVRSMDLPILDPSYGPMYYLMKEVSKKYRLAIGGDGGDELFYGYKRHVFPFILWVILRSCMTHQILLVLEKFCLKYKLYKLVHIFRSSTDDFVLSFLSQGRHCYKIEKSDGNRENIFSELLRSERKYFLSKYVLRKSDSASMANSVELRAPFLSLKLREQVNIKFYLKNVNKYVLRKYLRKNNVRISRKKMGFTPKIVAGDVRLDKFEEYIPRNLSKVQEVRKSILMHYIDENLFSK